jgi:hypothetical protein
MGFLISSFVVRFISNTHKLYVQLSEVNLVDLTPMIKAINAPIRAMK